MSFSNRRFGNPAFLRQFFICTFFLLYLRGKEEKKYEKKKKTRNSFLCPTGIFLCSASQNNFSLAKCYARSTQLVSRYNY